MPTKAAMAVVPSSKSRDLAVNLPRFLPWKSNITKKMEKNTTGIAINWISLTKVDPSREYHSPISVLDTLVYISLLRKISSIPIPIINPNKRPISILLENLTFFFLKRFINTTATINKTTASKVCVVLIFRKLVKKLLFVIFNSFPIT